MNFIEAVKLLQLDKNIKLMRRTKDFEITLDKIGIFLTATCVIDDKIYKDEPFTVTINEILAEDWYGVKNEKLYTFEEALKAYKLGKNIRRKNNYMIYDNCELDRDDIMANDWIIIDNED